MKKSNCVSSQRYALARFVHLNREHVGWVVTALICFLLWFVNHENEWLIHEISDARVALVEKDRRIVELRGVNTKTLLRRQGLESGQQLLLQKLEEGKQHGRQ